MGGAGGRASEFILVGESEGAEPPHRCKRQLQDAGHNPNMWILPRGMKPYIALDKNNTSYFLKGPAGQALYDSALNGKNVNQVGGCAPLRGATPPCIPPAL